MKFSSMRAYFYKLHNMLYITILIPLLSFTYLYLEAQAGMAPVIGKHTILTYLLVAGFGAVSVLSFRHFRQKVAKVRRIAGLGEKLKRYAAASIVRFVLMGLACVLLVSGYWLTGSQFFIVLFMISLTAFSVWWPSPGKVCKDLRLKGDEREMVFHRRDA